MNIQPESYVQIEENNVREIANALDCDLEINLVMRETGERI